MLKIAPYANKQIPISLGSTTGLRYKTVHCIECGAPIIERNNTQIFRLGVKDMPEVVKLSVDGSMNTHCHRCSQRYSLIVDTNSSSLNSGVPLYMQPQSIFMAIEPVKKLRDIYCIECGKAFYSISDSMKLISDNTMPIDMLDPEQYGPFESWCKFHHCKQRWSIFV